MRRQKDECRRMNAEGREAGGLASIHHSSFIILHSPSARSAFSLLEVILALAILAGAIAVIGELTRQSLESSRFARDATYAQLLCESKMADVLAGLELPDPIADMPCDAVLEPGQPPWLYSIDCMPTPQEGLLEVSVCVYQDLPPERRPISCTLVRWMLDPMYAIAAETLETESTGETMP